MSALMTIDVDTAALLAALAEMPDAVMARVKVTSKVTADRIAQEMRARVRRRTGQTGDAITVEESRDGTGYVVFVGNNREHIAFFLEVGTKFMPRSAFFYPAVRLEEGPHTRRVLEAVEAAIAAKGLGD